MSESPLRVGTLPLNVVKAELFKSLGHPARIRVLEVLAEGEHSVAQLLPIIGLEPSHLSQQLGVLRRTGLISSRRSGTTVIYRLSHPLVGDLLAVARAVLRDVISDRVEALTSLQTDVDDADDTTTPDGRR